MNPKYSHERYNPTLAHCRNLSLVFNGKTLEFRGGGKDYSYPAVSGHSLNGKFLYDVSQQQRTGGPIPEGVYWVDPKQLWERPLYEIGPIRQAWGNYRLTIHPFNTTATYDRGGFFIHGGDIPGSAGCIDLTHFMDDFVQDLRNELKSASSLDCQIHLTVHYPDSEAMAPYIHWEMERLI